MQTIRVLLLALEGPAAARTVTPPEEAWKGVDTLPKLLALAFEWGQNDFQPLKQRSVSVGDVVELTDRQMMDLGERRRRWICLGRGWGPYGETVESADLNAAARLEMYGIYNDVRGTVRPEVESGAEFAEAARMVTTIAEAGVPTETLVRNALLCALSVFRPDLFPRKPEYANRVVRY